MNKSALGLIGDLIIARFAHMSEETQAFAMMVTKLGEVEGTNKIRKLMITQPSPAQADLTAQQIYANCVAIVGEFDTVFKVHNGRVCVPRLFAATPEEICMELPFPDDVHAEVAAHQAKMEAGMEREAGELARHATAAAMDSVKH